MNAFYEKYEALAVATAQRIAPAIRRYGWTVEDARQQALMSLWELALDPPPQADAGYVVVTVRRSILQAAGRPGGCGEIPLTVDYADKQHDAVALFVIDVLDEAPDVYRSYLRWKMFGGEKPEFARTVPSLAAQWLTEQLSLYLEK